MLGAETSKDRQPMLDIVQTDDRECKGQMANAGYSQTDDGYLVRRLQRPDSEWTGDGCLVWRIQSTDSQCLVSTIRSRMLGKGTTEDYPNLSILIPSLYDCLAQLSSACI